jgi:hypothetical protein
MDNLDSYKLNDAMLHAFQHIAAKEYEVNVEKKLPPLAVTLINMGKDAGVNIEITYGIFAAEGNNGIAGYKIAAPDFGKSTFKQDVYMEDESQENLEKARVWMGDALMKFKKLTDGQ